MSTGKLYVSIVYLPLVLCTCFIARSTVEFIWFAFFFLYRKNSKAKEDEFINTTYSIGKDNCTVLDVLFKPIKYVMDMNSMFNDLGFMTLDREDTVYVNEIKHYLKQV